ncbi:hypothetical protein VTL71DRAFT_12910 [Oculimacula yallundae]|uniref:Zn(2)-C6 fungal-type domain-containing protein n=1 Tax=Oculimacula yallundae TaxID=86028 RepID=A0ABR4CNX0_9HELO
MQNIQSAALIRAPTARRARIMKPGIVRSRKGCITCRKRKKKCDETPGSSCRNCDKGNIKCSGYPERGEWPERQLRRPSTRNSQTVVPHSNTVTQQLDTIDTFEINVSMEASPMFSQDVQDYDGVMTTSDFNYNNTDLMVPLYPEHFSFNGVVFPFEEMHQLRACYDIPSPLPHIIVGVDTPLHGRLFDHFRCSMSKVLTTTPGLENPFNTIVLPLAICDKTLMKLLLSVAGSQLLRRSDPGSEPELEEETIRLHHEAQQDQHRRVQILESRYPEHPSEYTDQYLEIVFATYLVLCLYEICKGSGDGTGNEHLASAGRIIALATSTAREPERSSELYSGRRTQIDSFLLDFYVYHVWLARVTAPSIPIIQPEYDQSINILGQDKHLVGVQDGLIKFIARISKLRTDIDKNDGKKDYPLLETAFEIRDDLNAWQPHPTSSKPEYLVSSFYQKALFIWLFSIINPNKREDPKVQNFVRDILMGMREIGSEDGVMACMLFPLFVAGTAALSIEDREEVVGHFAKLKKWSAFGNIDSTLQAVIRMWGLHAAREKDSWNWVKQLQETRTSILVT